MGLTTAGANLFLDLIFGQNQADLATYYIGLVRTEPDINDTGSTINEPSGGAYARVAVTNNGTNFAAAEAGEKVNDTLITFPTATGNWGNITFVVICDAASGGNLLAWGRLSSPTQVVSGRTVSFEPGVLSATASSG